MCNKNTLKASFKDFNLPLESWEQVAQQRAKLRFQIRKDADVREAKRIYIVKRKCKERKVKGKTVLSIAIAAIKAPLFWRSANYHNIKWKI